MINATYSGETTFAAALRVTGALLFPLNYIRLKHPQTREETVMLLELISSNDSWQIFRITQDQKQPLKEARYEYEIIGEQEEVEILTGPVLERGFFNFKDDRDIKDIYR